MHGLTTCSLLRPVLEWLTSALIATDLRSAHRYLNPDGEQVYVRALGGHGVRLRPGTTDRIVLKSSLLGRSHLPPVTDPRLIWDLGANIGVTVAHMAHLFPGARVVGVELDPANYSEALRNTRPWSERCELVSAAAWVSDGTVRFRRVAGQEQGARIAADGDQVQSISLNTLRRRTGTPDYVKMDVEGAERILLTEQTDWARGVRSIKVELHGSYTIGECLRDLEDLGFVAWEQPQPWWPPFRGRPVAVGVRRNHTAR